MRIKLFAASLIILLTQTMALAAPAPSLLTPSGPWHVEYAGSMCLLSRPYGEDQATRLILKPSMTGESLEIIVNHAKTGLNGRFGKVTVAIAGKALAGEVYFSAYSTAKARLVRIRVEDDKLALSALRGTLSIDAEHESRHLFTLTGIERALPALSLCLDQLRAIHNVDKAGLAAIVIRPKSYSKEFFSTDDYPAAALREGQSGTVEVLVWVEVNGRVSTCEIIESSGSSLDQATCDLYKRRGRFTPAKDAAGKAIRAPISTRIKWAM